MRVAHLSRTDLGERHIRLDPAYYVGRQRVRSQIGDESSRIVPLADLIVSIHDGARLPAVVEGIPAIRLANVTPCELDLSRLSQVDGSAANWINVRVGDVLFTRAAQPFRAAAVLDDGGRSSLTISSELAVIRPRPAVLPEYLAVAICTPTINQTLRDLAYRARASAPPRLRLSDIQRLPIPLPPRSLQELLANQYRQAVTLTAQARSEIQAVAAAIHTEIDHRVQWGAFQSPRFEVHCSALGNRWDVSFHRGNALRAALESSNNMRHLVELAKTRISSLQGLSEDDEVLAIKVDDVNDETRMVENAERSPLRTLSDRMRQRLEPGDVLLCTTGGGDHVAYLDEGVESQGGQIVASATFTALRFAETPRVFAVTLSHPLVRHQLTLLSSGSFQRFVSKRDLDDLLIPVLGQVWREDFEDRLTRAMQRRREALVTRSALIGAADEFLREAMH